MFTYDKNDKPVLLKTARNCYYTDTQDVLQHAKQIIYGIKRNAAYYKKQDPNTNLDARPWTGHKRYLLDGEEIGTLRKLKVELDWCLDDEERWFVSRMWCNGLNQVVIEVQMVSSFNRLTNHLCDPDGGAQ